MLVSINLMHAMTQLGGITTKSHNVALCTTKRKVVSEGLYMDVCSPCRNFHTFLSSHRDCAQHDLLLLADLEKGIHSIQMEPRSLAPMSPLPPQLTFQTLTLTQPCPTFQSHRIHPSRPLRIVSR
jgi:hypothetical protein